MTVLVFLHVPKTAGQSVHSQLVKTVGKTNVSPVRTHTQALDGPQMPAGYGLYSGHIDWTELDTLPQDRFVFTVLRDPKERIASFYFFLKKEAKALTPSQRDLPQNENKRRIMEASAEEYFFGGSDVWQRFILDHYDNFYCSYFASRKMRGRSDLAGLSDDEIIARAKLGLDSLNGVYSTNRLDLLENDLQRITGKDFSVTGTFVNKGSLPQDQPRWPQLLSMFESDASRRRLESFTRLDDTLMTLALPVLGSKPDVPKRRWFSFSR